MSETKPYTLFCGGAVAGVVVGWLLGKSSRLGAAKKLLKGNGAWMTNQELCLASGLVAIGQGHLLAYWPRAGTDDDAKKQMMTCLITLMSRAACDLESLRTALILPPKPRKDGHVLEAHGDARDDPYYWMRDDSRRDPFVRRHLEAENDYMEAMMADTVPLQHELLGDMMRRTQEEDMTAPLRRQNYYYYEKTLKGQNYAIHCRRRVSDVREPPNGTAEMDSTASEEILLDENVAARGRSYSAVTGLRVSPDEQYLAYLQDTVGCETYTLNIRHIRSGKYLLRKGIDNAWTDCEWSADSRALYYLTVDDRGRPCQLWQHIIRSSPQKARMVFYERDPTFNLSLHKTRDQSTIYIRSQSSWMSECLVWEASAREVQPRVLLPRSENVFYWIEHHSNSFFFRIQDADRLNSEITVAPSNNPTRQRKLIPCETESKIEDFVLCQKYLTVFCREQNAVQTAFVYDLPKDFENGDVTLGKPRPLTFDAPIFSLTPGEQGDFESEVLRMIFTSLITPRSVVDQHLGTFARSVQKMDPVLGEYDEVHYRSERVWAMDEIAIPISIVYKLDVAKLDGTDPLLMDVYGAYEVSLDPQFSMERLALLQRGFIYAMAHVRGGGERGREWYESGRLLKKKASFEDTIECAKHLINRRYCSPSKLCIRGRSAGGLTAAVAVNLNPELFAAAIMHVPFVDVLTSLSDPGLPLTTEEWGEWGNPQNEEHYTNLKSYSPVDNVAEQTYPHLLLTGGYHDARVGFWEPAKFAAKIRDRQRGSNMVLFKCTMGVGHFQGSARFEKYKQEALDFAFLLKVVNKLPKRGTES